MATIGQFVFRYEEMVAISDAPKLLQIFIWLQKKGHKGSWDAKPTETSVDRDYCSQPRRSVSPRHSMLCALYVMSRRSTAPAALAHIEETLTVYDCTNWSFVLLQIHGILCHGVAWRRPAVTHVIATSATLAEAYGMASSVYIQQETAWQRQQCYCFVAFLKGTYYMLASSLWCLSWLILC